MTPPEVTTEVERQRRKDRDLENKLANGVLLLRDLAREFEGEKLAGDLRETAERLQDERLRIVQRWD